MEGRTSCKSDYFDSGKCITDECDEVLKCCSVGVSLITLVKYTIFCGSANNKDYYYVNLVDGYNVALGVKEVGGSSDCQHASCITVIDFYADYPVELRVMDRGFVVAWKSTCTTFNRPEFCCIGYHATPYTCSPAEYSKMFRNACPTAYSYAYDDASRIRTCSVLNGVF
ncbi:hypothetical protein V6N13_048133 [Hibiscus sabdariffa]|uniref:Thaumatin-like protein n=1 Tax=Hibiscus sabdariffa TaxID=183260 RepID=A0ABR2F686_9ROSI